MSISCAPAATDSSISRQPRFKRRQAGRKPRRYRRHRQPCRPDATNRLGHHLVIDADRADAQAADAQAGLQVGTHRLQGLGAQPAHAARRVVARQRREVDALHRLEQPRGLEFLLHAAACRQTLHAAGHGRRIDAHGGHAVEIERRAFIARHTRCASVDAHWNATPGRRVARPRCARGLALTPRCASAGPTRKPFRISGPVATGRSGCGGRSPGTLDLPSCGRSTSPGAGVRSRRVMISVPELCTTIARLGGVR